MLYGHPVLHQHEIHIFDHFLKESGRNARTMQFKGVDIAQGSVTIEPDKVGNVRELHMGKANVQAFLYAHTQGLFVIPQVL
jgi:hypothetical protein